MDNNKVILLSAITLSNGTVLVKTMQPFHEWSCVESITLCSG